MNVTFRPARVGDAVELAALHTTVSADLTRRFGPGPWSAVTSERAVLTALDNSQITLAISRGGIVATVRLQAQRPWALDVAQFTPAGKAVYLTAMAVAPAVQGKGVGTLLLKEAVRQALAWPAEAIRLDAYDAEAGASEFYRKRGFREVTRGTYREARLVFFEKTLV